MERLSKQTMLMDVEQKGLDIGGTRDGVGTLEYCSASWVITVVRIQNIMHQQLDLTIARNWAVPARAGSTTFPFKFPHTANHASPSPLHPALLDRKLIRASTLAFGFYGRDWTSKPRYNMQFNPSRRKRPDGKLSQWHTRPREGCLWRGSEDWFITHNYKCNNQRWAVPK